MTIKQTLLTLFILLNLLGCKTPESISKDFSESKSKGECESLILMTIGDARKTMINYDCKPYNAVIINDIGCETGKESATCIYSENRAYYTLDAEVETTLKLVKMDHDWKISKETKSITQITGGDQPELVADVFIKLLSEGNCEIAKLLTVSTAKNKFTNEKQNECESFNLEITETRCDVNGNSATYYTTEKRNFGREEKYVYNLVKTGGEWRIIDFKRDLAGSPELTTEAFVTFLFEGNCTDALKLTTSSASETVAASIDSGCEGYQSEIIGNVQCKTQNNFATCTCTEKRDILGEMKFNYELEKIDGEWKVSSYAKDMGDIDSISE